MPLALHRIDVHHHPSPPGYLNAREGNDPPAPVRLAWTVEKSLQTMDEGGCATSILSLPHAASIWGDHDSAAGKEKGRKLAREWNDFMKKLATDHPGRFGIFATVPMLDIDGSLKEMEYALDKLGADGVFLTTNIGDKWLGDRHYWPFFEELNRRKVTVYTHPVAPNCTAGMYEEFNDSVIEFGTDTTRAIAKLLFTGAAAKFPDINWIFSHAGGTMPFITERFMRAHMYSKADVKNAMPKGVMHELQKLYYDTAQAAHFYAMAPLKKMVPTSQIVFGTDYPYRTAGETAGMLKECGCFNDAELRAIDRDNALRILPKWR
jgi:predicted TIM-barrel fold metal-dependent hydrolase